MAIAFVQGTGVQSVGSVASVSKAFASNITAGSAIIVVGVVASQELTATSCADTLSSAYTQDKVQETTAPNTETAIWSTPNSAGGACTVTMDPTGNAVVSVGIAEISGAPTSAILDNANSGTGTSTTPSTGTITTANNAIVLAVTSHNGANTTLTEGFTLIFEDEDATDMPFNYQYRITSADAAMTWTYGASRQWTAVGAAYKELATKSIPPGLIRPVWRNVTRRFYR